MSYRGQEKREISLLRLTLGSAAIVALCSCGSQEMPGTNEALPENFTIGEGSQQGSADAARPVDDIPQTPDLPEKDRNMAKPPVKPASPTPPAPPPPTRPEIRPSPFQPPAEVDPVHRDPGDRVPE